MRGVKIALNRKAILIALTFDVEDPTLIKEDLYRSAQPRDARIGRQLRSSVGKKSAVCRAGITLCGAAVSLRLEIGGACILREREILKSAAIIIIAGPEPQNKQEKQK